MNKQTPDTIPDGWWVNDRGFPFYDKYRMGLAETRGVSATDITQAFSDIIQRRNTKIHEDVIIRAFNKATTTGSFPIRKERKARNALKRLYADACNVTVGPFTYDHKTDQIFFDGETKHKIDKARYPIKFKFLKALIQSHPKPISKQNMALEVYGKVSVTSDTKVDSMHRDTMEMLEETIENGSSQYISYRDILGFRICPKGIFPTLEQAKAEDLIAWGPWAYDTQRDILFYRSKRFETLSKDFLVAMKALLQQHPKAIPEEELRTLTGLSDQKLCALNNKPFSNHYPKDVTPIFHSTPARSYSLAADLKDLQPKDFEEMDMIMCDQLAVSLKHKKAWMCGKPVTRLQKNVWSVLEYLAQNKGRFIKKEELAIAVYGHNSTQNQKSIDSFIHRLKVRGKKLASRDSDPKTIRAKRYMGYGVFENETHFRNAISKAQANNDEQPIAALG